MKPLNSNQLDIYGPIDIDDDGNMLNKFVRIFYLHIFMVDNCNVCTFNYHHSLVIHIVEKCFFHPSSLLRCLLLCLRRSI